MTVKQFNFEIALRITHLEKYEIIQFDLSRMWRHDGLHNIDPLIKKKQNK